MHLKYGPVVRIAPDELAYIDSEAWKDIYGQRPGKEEVPKDPPFYDNASGVGYVYNYMRVKLRCDDRGD
jgi:hypothetical protein